MPTGAVVGSLVGTAGAALLTLRVVRTIKASRRERQHLKAAEAAQARAWAAFTARHAEVADQIVATETDIETILTKPALTDLSIPVIAAAWDAWRDLQALDRDMPCGLDPECDISTLPYPQAVIRACAAWRQADIYATRVGQHMAPPAERQRARARVARLIRTLCSVRAPTKPLTRRVARSVSD